MATPNRKHGVDFTVNGNDAAKVNSMKDGGPLKVHKESWFATVASDLLDPPVGTSVSITYHDLEYVVGSAWLLAADLAASPLSWVAKMAPIGQLIADLCEAGVSWDKADTWDAPPWPWPHPPRPRCHCR